MASSPDFVTYVCEQLAGVGELRFRKMFGEYMIYINEKPVVLVCDDTVFVKMLPCLAPLLAGRPTGAPYGGAKEHYILDPDDRGLMKKAAALAEQATPVPKKRVSKSKKGQKGDTL